MAQGKTKGLQQKAPSARHAAKAAAAPKKGKRAIPPKKTAAVKQAAMHKVRFLKTFLSVCETKNIMLMTLLSFALL
jgi:hypothetical protein